MVRLTVTFLGTSAAVPTSKRGLPAIAVKREGEVVLMDCGEGVQRRVLSESVGLGSETSILVTHLHGDHVTGLLGLLQTMSLAQRRRPLNIVGPTKEFSTDLTSQSRNDGDVSRSGNLTAMLTVRVTGFESGGQARIEGTKTVTMDGRTQQMTLKGVVRPQDVLAQNRVLSSSVADAVITYKGKKIAPKSGLLGGILNMLWP